jgi:hypothetical protein
MPPLVRRSTVSFFLHVKHSYKLKGIIFEIHLVMINYIYYNEAWYYVDCIVVLDKELLYGFYERECK